MRKKIQTFLATMMSLHQSNCSDSSHLQKQTMKRRLYHHIENNRRKDVGQTNGKSKKKLDYLGNFISSLDSLGNAISCCRNLWCCQDLSGFVRVCQVLSPEVLGHWPTPFHLKTCPEGGGQQTGSLNYLAFQSIHQTFCACFRNPQSQSLFET